MWYFLIERHCFNVSLFATFPKSLTASIKVMLWVLVVRLIAYAVKELVVIFKNTGTQKAKIAGNIVQQMSFFSSETYRAHIMIQIRCSVMVLMWHVGSAICPSPAIHIITTCCSDSWALSVMRLGDI